MTNPIKELITHLARLEDDERRVRAASRASADRMALEPELRRISSQKDQIVAALHELHG